MQRINGTPFMHQKCIPLPHRQPQVNVMDLYFCIKDVIFNVNETSLFSENKTNDLYTFIEILSKNNFYIKFKIHFKYKNCFILLNNIYISMFIA